MKMEFGEEGETPQPNEEMGLAARLTKKVKTERKGKGENKYCRKCFIDHFEFSQRFKSAHRTEFALKKQTRQKYVIH